MSGKKNIFIYGGIIISIALGLYCIVYITNYYSANNILYHFPKSTKANNDTLSPNEIGDTIGGVLSPIIGLLAAILTFLAFYMQKVANDDIRAQFKIQQFESQFFEMLNLHKQNVDELEIKRLKDGIQISGRNVFETMTYEFNELLSYITFSDSTLNENQFETAYYIFFWGYSQTEAESVGLDIRKLINENPQTNEILDFSKHNGFSSKLGHYFRHLFMMVKFVVTSNVITDYKGKMSYLKILRAQLSNHEQIILFYNWVCIPYGGAWEDSNNRFFTHYKMIHNLWLSELYNNQFIVDKVNSLIEKYNLQPQESPLFEFQKGDFSLKMKDVVSTPLSEL